MVIIPTVCAPDETGYVADPESCDAYYHCSEGLPSKMFCADGYEFDEDKKVSLIIGLLFERLKGVLESSLSERRNELTSSLTECS